LGLFLILYIVLILFQGIFGRYMFGICSVYVRYMSTRWPFLSSEHNL